MTEPLALVVSTDDLTWDAAHRSFRGRLSTIDPTFWMFHQAHYRGFGLRSAKTGKVLPFYIDTLKSRYGSHYTLRPTAMALEECPTLEGVRLSLTYDCDRSKIGKRRAAELAATREQEARRAGDLTAAQAYAATRAVMERHASCPGVV